MAKTPTKIPEKNPLIPGAIRAEDLERFDNALSDFRCWIEGFKAAGGTYSPGSEYTLQDLRDALSRFRSASRSKGAQ